VLIAGCVNDSCPKAISKAAMSQGLCGDALANPWA
jgi:hypothetical protein